MAEKRDVAMEIAEKIRKLVIEDGPEHVECCWPGLGVSDLIRPEIESLQADNAALRDYLNMVRYKFGLPENQAPDGWGIMGELSKLNTELTRLRKIKGYAGHRVSCKIHIANGNTECDCGLGKLRAELEREG